MNLSEPFIRKPVMTTLRAISAAVFGIAAYFALPVSELPDIAYPVISVTTNYPGASPRDHGQQRLDAARNPDDGDRGPAPHYLSQPGGREQHCPAICVERIWGRRRLRWRPPSSARWATFHRPARSPELSDL